MDSMILIILATFFFLPYIVSQYKYKKKKRKKERIMQLPQVEAGPTKHFCKKRIDLTPLVDVDMENISMDPALSYFVVKNQCMQIKGISDGDIIGVRMLTDREKQSVLHRKKQQILLIHLDDRKFRGYKIREQGEITSDGMAYDTYHYKGGRQRQSSAPHSMESIKGVVMEVHQKQYTSCRN